MADFLLELLGDAELLHLTHRHPGFGEDSGEAGVAVLEREPAGALVPADIRRFLIV